MGKTVVSVAYTTDGDVNNDEVSSLIEIKPGVPLTDDATGATIRNLFATRQFSDIRIETEDAPGGVAVTVVLFRAFRVAPLKFSGSPVSRPELRKVVPFTEGTVFQAEVVALGAAAIKRRVAEEGYLQAKVTPEVSYDRKTFNAKVLYRVDAGKPARVAKLFFDGATAPFLAALEKKAHMKPGDRYRDSKAKADATRLTAYLHKQSRLKGTVELIAAQPTDDGRVMPVYRISVGPEVRFETVGIKTKLVRNEISALTEGQVFDEDFVLQYVEQKRKELQGSGHYHAKVDYAMKTAPEALTVTVTVDEGPKFAIEKIAIAGNQSVKEKDLLALMVTHKKGFPILRPGHLVDEDLTGDVSAILGYYQTRGWINAKIDKPQITDGSKPGRLVVTIPIKEGPRAVVAAVKVDGAANAGDDAGSEKKLLIKKGAFYNPNLVRQDVFNLQSWYHDHGWREAAVKSEVVVSAEGLKAEVAYHVEEGTKTFFGKTIVRGNTRTRSARITRLLKWKEGEPFSEADMLTTQRNLTRTGVFRRVDLRPQPADPKSGTRTVEIDLQEGRPLSLLYGVGYQYAPTAQENRNDPFAIAGISYNNLFGQMQSIGFETQYAPLSGRGRIQVSFREPFLFNLNVPLTVIGFYTREPIQDIDIRRLGTVIESSRYYGKYLRVAMRYEYQRITTVNPQDLSNIERENFPRFDRPIEESTIGPNAFYDRRDDVVDPHAGYYVTAGYKYAFPFINAVARYHKVSGQAAWFRKVAGSVLALGVRAGAIWPYGPSDIQVPIAERFFAGGRSTNRAFDTDLLGIPGVTVDYDAQATPHTGSGTGSCAPAFPTLTAWDCNFGPRIVGGNGFLSINAELRIPIFDGFGGTLFYDASQVWQDPTQIRLSLEGSSGLRQGIGVGLRYMTPIGPVRVEYGWPVSPRTIPYEVTTTDSDGNKIILGSATTRERGKFFVSIGYPF